MVGENVIHKMLLTTDGTFSQFRRKIFFNKLFRSSERHCRPGQTFVQFKSIDTDVLSAKVIIALGLRAHIPIVAIGSGQIVFCIVWAL